MGHDFTAWGDEKSAGHQTANPSQIWVTDSEDLKFDVKHLNYGTPQWTLSNYWNQPNIKYYTTLKPTDLVTDNKLTQKIYGSLKIKQKDQSAEASDLHYKVGTDVDIFSYNTRINWMSSSPPMITEDATPPRELTVDWDLTGNPVPPNQYVTIDTEFVVGKYNKVNYPDVYFTYPAGGRGDNMGGFGTEIFTADIMSPEEVVPNAIGGYVIAAFDLFSDPEGSELLGEGRMEHEYDYYQDPEHHEFRMESFEGRPLFVGNIRFGHSYAWLEGEGLWDFQDWMTADDQIRILEPFTRFDVFIDWERLLPFPEAHEPWVLEPLAGDFDGDRDVDGNDFLTWQRGESPIPLSQSDLEVWQANFGDVASPVTATSTTVPEPTTGLMLMLGMASLLFRRHLEAP